MHAILFAVSVYFYITIISYITNKEYSIISDKTVADLEIDYRKIKDDNLKLECYSFILKTKGAIYNLENKTHYAHSIFDKSILVFLVIMAFMVIFTLTFANTTYLIVASGVIYICALILDMFVVTYKSNYDKNYCQIIRYIKELYGSDINDVLEDELVMYN